MNLHLKAIEEETDTAEIVYIKLENLVAWNDNPRKTGRDTGLDELVASIDAHGLLQSLVVTKPDQDGNAMVIAGERRLKALNKLAAVGKIAPSARIACRVAQEDQDIAELALAENAVREAMHPADQFEAFMKLKKDGMDMAEIAARFGLTEAAVKQRLKLASVSPAVLQAYRDGKITLSQTQAFAITKDHVRQDEVLEQAFEEADRYDEGMEVSDIRAALTDKEITARDERVQYVTLEAYEAAGGTTTRDLFDEDERYIVIDNPKLLQDLFEQKIEARVSALKADGWSWAEFRETFEWQHRQNFITLHDTDDLCGTPELHAEWNRLDTLYDELEERINDMDVAADDPELKKLIARQSEVDNERDTCLKKISGNWPEAVKAIAGAIVTIRWGGKEDVIHVVHKDNKNLLDKIRAGEEVSADENDNGNSAAIGEDANNAEPKESQEPQDVEVASMPHALVETLTAHKSAAIANELANRPQLALVCVVHALLDDLLTVHGDNCVDLVTRETGYGKLDNLVEGIYNELDTALPADKHTDRASLWYWLLSRDNDQLLEVLAKVAALCVDTITRKHNDNNAGRQNHGNAIAQSLGIDMTKYFTPTAENYFNHVGKGRILADLREALKSEALDPSITKMKKADLALRAERVVIGTGWLPAPLRVPMPGEAQED